MHLAKRCIVHGIKFIDQSVPAATMTANTLVVREHDDRPEHSVAQLDEEKKPDAFESDDSQSSISISIQSTPKRTWRSFLWDTFDKSPEERKFLFKLDAVILTFASLGYFIKYLDQVNVTNAYVSGMKEDLNLYGNELNYMTTVWTVGYVIGEIPR